MRYFSIIAIMLVLLVSISMAEVPQKINYQGCLTSNTGNSIEDGNHILRFTIYNAAVDGDELWTSGFREVTVSSGLFNYILGDSTAFPDGLFDTDSPRYLGIKIGGDSELSNRIMLISVPYAIHSKLSDSSKIAISIPDNTVTTSKIANGSILFEDIAQNSATEGQVMKWNETSSAWEVAEANLGSSNWSVSDSVLYTNNYLGIARGGAENALYGNKSYTHVNLGVVCTTGTSGTNINFATVSGGSSNAATQSYSTIGGGHGNVASTIYTTVSGGRDNTAFDGGSTVSGGLRNTANGYGSTVGGGYDNTASGYSSTVCGGYSDTASGDYSTVSGGFKNSASGENSTVSGGSSNTASGNYSQAAGRLAKATHDGAFVWGDDTNSDVSSSANNQFTVRTTGGARFFTNTALTTGVTLAAGGGAWATVSDSTIKENIRPVDGDNILKKISDLDISRWNYETQDESIEHIGPMAQDFYRLFGLGDNNTTINTIDPDGISLAAIKALIEKNDELQESNVELKKELSDLRVLVEQLLEQNKK